MTAYCITSLYIRGALKHVVQVDVREQRRNRSPLRRSRLGLRPFPVLDDPRGQPFLDQPQDPSVRDPVLEEPLQATDWSRLEK